MVSAWAAYTVYTYNTPTAGGIGMAGRINDNGGASVTTYPDLTTGLNGDPQVEGIIPSAGSLRAIVTNRIATATPVPNTYVYNVVTPISPPTSPLTRQWPNVRNFYGIAKVGSLLYALDFDNARITEINASTFNETGITYTLASGLVPAGYSAHGQAIIEIGGQLYGLFSFADATWENYAPSLLVRFTINPGVSISVGATDYNDELVKNAFQLAVSGSDLYIAGLGGAQVAGGYNPDSRLQKIAYASANLTTATVTDVLQPDSGTPYEIRDISFDGTTAYVLWGSYNSSWNMAGKLEKTDFVNTPVVIDTFNGNAPGYFWSAQFTPENSRIWFARGNEILIYDAANPATAPVTLAITPGELINTGQSYDSLNDLAFVGATGTYRAARGYRSPVQVSQSARGRAARALASGRPELTGEELLELNAQE